MINKVQYYFFNAINNMKNFDPTNIKIDDKSYKNILIYCIRCDNQRFEIRKSL